MADSQFSLHYLRAVDAAINVATIVRNNAETSEKACTQILALLADSGGFQKPIARAALDERKPSGPGLGVGGRIHGDSGSASLAI